MTKIQHYTCGGYPLTKPSYRPFIWLWWKQWLNPKTYWRTVKYFCQRGWRGYADCDAWDADTYLETVMLGLMLEIQEHKHGYPANLCTCTKSDGFNCDDNASCDGSAIWDRILQEIIDGLWASRELVREETVPDEAYPHLGEPIEWEEVTSEEPYTNPMTGKEEKLFSMKEPADGRPRFDREVWDAWAKPLQQKKKRATLLLVRHWGSFWD